MTTTNKGCKGDYKLGIPLCEVSRNVCQLIKKREENSTGRLFITGYGNMSDVFLSSGKLSVKHEIGPRVIWESSQYTYLWVTYLSLSFLVHMNDETSRLNFPRDLPSSLFHQQTTLETTKICNITQRVQSAKEKTANHEKALEHHGIFILISKIGSYISNDLWWMAFDELTA